MSMTKRTFFLLALSLTTAACAGSRDSLLEQGERVDTGRREYDDYFGSVAELREQVDRIDSDMFKIRERLVEEMNLDVDIAIGHLLQATRERVNKAKDYGTALSLQLSPAPKIVIERGKLEAEDKDENLFTAIEQSAERAMDKYKAHAQLLELASELEAKRPTLADKIDKLPKNMADKKDLIETEIVAAGRVLSTAESKLLRVTRTLSHFLVGLVEAVNTGALENQVNKCDEAIAFFEENKAKKKKPKRKWGRKKWRRPAGTPRPAPTQPAGGDFEM
jgi:vacuolar-type H+-ATPase subunit I/STV1